jgi:hypothetical protein
LEINGAGRGAPAYLPDERLMEYAGVQCSCKFAPALLWHFDGPRDDLPLAFIICPKQ